MIITLDEMKNYLRVDHEDDDKLIKSLIISSEQLCMDVARISDKKLFEKQPGCKFVRTQGRCKPSGTDSFHPCFAIGNKAGGILMDVALLNVKITFQKNAVEVDAIGNHKNRWTDYYTCHATVSGESGT